MPKSLKFDQLAGSDVQKDGYGEVPLQKTGNVLHSMVKIILLLPAICVIT